MALVAVALALPLVGLAILLAAPDADVHWQHQPSHFWLVLVTAGLNAALAYATGAPLDDDATVASISSRSASSRPRGSWRCTHWRRRRSCSTSPTWAS